MRLSIVIAASVKNFTVGQRVAFKQANNEWYCGKISKLGRTRLTFTGNDGYDDVIKEADLGRVLKPINKVGKKTPYTNAEIKSLFEVAAIKPKGPKKYDDDQPISITKPITPKVPTKTGSTKQVKDVEPKVPTKTGKVAKLVKKLAKVSTPAPADTSRYSDDEIAERSRYILSIKEAISSASVTGGSRRDTMKIIISLSRVKPDITNPGDYLVVEDRGDRSTWHLPVKKNGHPDHHLMGSAYAALTKTFRGKAYSGPNKAQALKKLKALYKREGLDLPG